MLHVERQVLNICWSNHHFSGNQSQEAKESLFRQTNLAYFCLYLCAYKLSMHPKRVFMYLQFIHNASNSMCFVHLAVLHLCSWGFWCLVIRLWRERRDYQLSDYIFILFGLYAIKYTSLWPRWLNKVYSSPLLPMVLLSSVSVTSGPLRSENSK